MTRQRSLIRKIVLGSKLHLSAQQIYDIAKEKMPSIAMATVYNNLNALVEGKEIQRIKIEGRVDLYDCQVIPHGHGICDSCGKIEDLHFKGMREYIEKVYGIEVNSYDLSIHYLCDTCKRQTILPEIQRNIPK